MEQLAEPTTIGLKRAYTIDFAQGKER